MKKYVPHLLFVTCIVAFAFMGYGLWLAIVKKEIYSAEAAAWVQAIGTVAAIGAAFGGAYYQVTKAALHAVHEQEHREDRFLRSIRTELTVLRDGFMRTTKIEAIPPVEKQPLVMDFYFPPERPFAIFDATAGNILDVRDDEKRTLIIDTYSKAKSVLVILKMNNEHIRALIQARRNSSVAQADENIAMAGIKESSAQFWERFGEVLENIALIERTFPRG